MMGHSGGPPHEARCPTCGTLCVIGTSSEGTSHFIPAVAEGERDELRANITFLREALQEILRIPEPCRNPDGDEQGIQTAKLIAREALDGR